ncbi:MAG TPA: isoprenylcysteine carboxylmethyltransferase family protein [Candidatus Polarisedimenticolia bacterium]|nr:isoprenylcysteine carboxylmethyltransferase family protein [Candidatus Polarisedimenticolia bacterium]
MQSEGPYRIAIGMTLLFLAYRARFLLAQPDAFARRARRTPGGPIDYLFPLMSSVGLLAAGAYLARPSLIAWASFPLPAWARWSGAGLSLAGLLLLRASQRALGACWTFTARLVEEHRIVRYGPYRWIRHPIFTGLILFLSGPLFISANWAVGLPPLAAILFDVLRRVRKEEATLISHFGEAYIDYMMTTGRFFPKMWP